MKYIITNVSSSDPDFTAFNWFLISLEDFLNLRKAAQMFDEIKEKFDGVSSINLVKNTGYFVEDYDIEDYLDNNLGNGIWTTDDPQVDNFLANATPADRVTVYPDSFQATLVPENTEAVLYSVDISFETIFSNLGLKNVLQSYKF